MTEIDVSIFNDVLGPVITGPSSSGTAGALRVARMARKFMPGFRKARLNVNEHTSINPILSARTAPYKNDPFTPLIQSYYRLRNGQLNKLYHI